MNLEKSNLLKTKDPDSSIASSTPKKGYSKEPYHAEIRKNRMRKDGNWKFKYNKTPTPFSENVISFSLQVCPNQKDDPCSVEMTKEGCDNRTVCAIPDLFDEMEEEIERQLEEKAQKTNLTVANVKNMIRAVITNKEVVQMVNYSLDKSIQKPAYEPKLTRAKTRELLANDPSASVYQIPLERKKHYTLLDESLQDDSCDTSDEEYRPVEDMSDESIAEATFEGESLPSPVAPPNEEMAEGSLGSIGQRTRSKLCLSETPLEMIEQAFIPPDITIDMYNTKCDDKDWANFLKAFTEPLDPTMNETADDDNDPEYNVMVDEEDERPDVEELRMDRAVKVSKKELDILLAELAEYKNDDDTSFNQLDVDFEELTRMEETPSQPAANTASVIIQQVPFTEQPMSQGNSGFPTSPAAQQVSQGMTLHQSPQAVSSGQGAASAESVSLAVPQASIFTLPPGSICALPRGAILILPPVADANSAATSSEPHLQSGAANSQSQTPPANRATLKTASSETISGASLGKRRKRAVVHHKSRKLRQKLKAIMSSIVVTPVIQGGTKADKNPEVVTVRIELPAISSYAHKPQLSSVPSDLTTDSSNSDQPLEETLPLMLPSHLELLRQQFRQHVQLLTQSFLLSYKSPALEPTFSDDCKNLLTGLNHFGVDNPRSLFKIRNLEACNKLVEDWQNLLDKPEGESVIKFMSDELDQLRSAQEVRRTYCIKLPRALYIMCARSTAFPYASMLPKMGFKFKMQSNVHLFPSEIYLIAIGLERFSELARAKEDASALVSEEAIVFINREVVPVRTPFAIAAQIDTLSKRSGYNPIKFFLKHGEAPPVRHEIIPVEDKKLIQQPLDSLPENWRKFFETLLSERRKEKELRSDEESGNCPDK